MVGTATDILEFEATLVEQEIVNRLVTARRA
jgi:hypothetical protein